MGKSQRENVVRGFSLVHDPEGSHYKGRVTRATLHPGGESKAWPGQRNVVRGFSLVHDPKGSHYRGRMTRVALQKMGSL